MASKKYLILAGVFSLLVSSATFGQSAGAQGKDMTYRGGSYDYLDTAYVPKSGQQQQRSFLANESIYPAKPRSMWELGVHGGLHMIAGDISPRPGFGGGLSLRKAIGHVVSVRVEYTGSFDYGLDYRPRFGGEGPWAAYGSKPYVANYKTATHALSADLLFSLNNVAFYKSQYKTNIYALIGYTYLAADVDVNARNSAGGLYDFSTINFGRPRRDIRKDLKSLLDGSYESNAPSGGNRPYVGRYKNNQLLRHGLDLGAGMAFKVSKRFNIGLEEKLTFVPGEDYLDGINAGKSNDFFTYTNVRLNFNLGNEKKYVEPLWWINPLDYAYSELNSPRHMKLPKPILDDSDGDGVTDQFDREPNTPKGAPVDTHGVSLDTDGDGVPDYKDKQLITPTYCQPVDADGVGKCPCPDSTCFEGLTKNTCASLLLPSISFKGSSTKLSSEMEAVLASVSGTLKANPSCNVIVTGHAGAKAKKAGVDLSSRRVDAVIDYLADKQGISRERFIKQNTPGDSNTVDLAPAQN